MTKNNRVKVSGRSARFFMRRNHGLWFLKYICAHIDLGNLCRLRHSHGWHARLCVASFAPRVILRSVTAGDRLPILPDCNRKFPAVVPLWKVIVGPRADELPPDPQGSGFSLGQQACRVQCRAPDRRATMRASGAGFLSCDDFCDNSWK